MSVFSQRRYHNDPEYRERIKAKSRKWNKEHPDKVREYVDRYDAKKRMERLIEKAKNEIS